VVEDSEPFRRFICSTLERLEFRIVGKVIDGLEAVEKAEELHPDLIVLDIGLPSLNGIEVARRVRKVSPKSKILFVSQESSPDVVQEALRTGARGYVIKTDAGSELVIALSVVLRGENFVGCRFAGLRFRRSRRKSLPRAPKQWRFLATPVNMATAHRHSVGFYSGDRHFLDDLTQFGSNRTASPLHVARRALLPVAHERGSSFHPSASIESQSFRQPAELAPGCS
jgi:DNA-binding NarL/FixJ family response regulator